MNGHRYPVSAPAPPRRKQSTTRAYLCLVLALLIDPVPGLLAFLRVLHPGRDGADLDLLQRCGEVDIERERVRRVDIASWWVLLQDLVLRACEGL